MGYSMMGAAVSCWFMGMSTCVCVVYLCRDESVQCDCIGVHVNVTCATCMRHL